MFVEVDIDPFSSFEGGQFLMYRMKVDIDPI